MKKILNIICILVFLMLALCSCGRSDITLTVNQNGSFDAEIVYGIDKALIAGDDVIEQVASIIKEPLDEKKIEYTEEDKEDFYIISTKKHFKNAQELTDASLWDGMPFVPKFTKEVQENTIFVTEKDGKITFSGNLNAKAFNAEQLISENKKAFGASFKIVAEKATANVKEEKNAYLWEGDASENVKVELTAEYKKNEHGAAKTTEKGTGIYIYLLSVIVIIAAVVFIIIKKKKTKGNEKGEEI